MEYNIEMIDEMASLLAETMKATMSAQQKHEKSTLRIEQIETGMREVLRQIGNQG
jgi:hypothetical protein